MGQIVVVVAAPQDGARAEEFAGRLRAEGVEAYAQELSDAWSEDRVGGVAASWPADAFILFCLTEAGADDPVLRALIARGIAQDGPDRHIFVVFDDAAARRADLATLLENHPVAGAGDLAPIAEHIRQQSASQAPEENASPVAPAAIEDIAVNGGLAAALELQLQKRAERREAIEALSDEETPQRFGARRASSPPSPPREERLEGGIDDAPTAESNEPPLAFDEPASPLAPNEEALEGAPFEPDAEDPPTLQIEPDASAPADAAIEAAPDADFEEGAATEDFAVAVDAPSGSETNAAAAPETATEDLPSAVEPEAPLQNGAEIDRDNAASSEEFAPLEPATETREEVHFEQPAPIGAAAEPEIAPPPQSASPPPLMSMDKPLALEPPPAPGVGAAASAGESLREQSLRHKSSGMFANRPRAEAPPAPQPLAAAQEPLERVDAMAFAPKTLRRGTPELLRISVFNPKARGKALREAKRADPRAAAAGAIAQLGAVARGAMLSAVIDARGAEADHERHDAIWNGDALNFDFALTADETPSVKQALITVRLLADDAQIGAITFVRPLARAKNDKPTKLNSREKLRRVDRVFLSYASFDRDQVSLIASAYERAGINCFFDRVGLKSGEEWKPRLLKEINKSDLFHLCWSRAAASSEWVEKETGHAMKRRRKAKRPDITIQMLDGPPWAPHPDSLDDLNFDDYARAAIVGYERGQR